MRVTIRGAGIIGLSCADELLRRGHDVTVVDPTPLSGATWAAAGMLTPAAEVWHGEEALLELGIRSLELWSEYAGRLGVELHRGGTLLTGVDAGDQQQVRRQAQLLSDLGRPAQEPDRRTLRSLEPTLSTRVGSAVWLPSDPSVDPRAVASALLTRVRVVPQAPDGEVTVLATGARLPSPYTRLVRGVRGEIVRARTDDPPGRVVRGWVRGRPTYVVPRADGEVVIGATSEEHDAAATATLGGVARLLVDAAELVPGLATAEFVEALARDRPGTADNLPLVGPTDQPGVLLAAGHFRHGVLLAPLTAQLIADHIETGAVDPVLDPRRMT